MLSPYTVLGISLNLKSSAGKEIAKRLIEWADVFIESFTAGAVDSLGIGYGPPGS